MPSASPRPRTTGPEIGARKVAPSARIVGTAMTPMHRRDLGAEHMARQVVADALGEAGLGAAEVDLVVFANATAGRLLDQGCIRGQSFLADAGLRNAGIVNVDNSCAGSASALHLATLAALAGTRTVLAVGVEKMWTGTAPRLWPASRTGCRSPTVGSCTASGRTRPVRSSWPSTRGGRLGHGGARCDPRAVRVHRGQGPPSRQRGTRTRSSAPKSPWRRCLHSAPIVPPLTRLMCSSFTDGAAAVVLTAAPRTGAPRIRESTVRSGDGEMDYHRGSPRRPRGRMGRSGHRSE